jgi:hypothetical protein
MTPDLEVDADVLRRCASDLAGTAARLSAGPSAAPPLAVASFGWATARTLTDLEAAARRRLDGLGEAIAHTGRALGEVAAGYDDTDTRAAARLRTLQ